MDVSSWVGLSKCARAPISCCSRWEASPNPWSPPPTSFEREGISATVVVIASVSPVPTVDLIRLVSAHTTAVTVEAHVTNGGIGSLLGEVIAGAARHAVSGASPLTGRTEGAAAARHSFTRHTACPARALSNVSADSARWSPGVENRVVRPVSNTPPETGPRARRSSTAGCSSTSRSGPSIAT